MPLCHSALTYSSSRPGKRDTAFVFSWTVLIGSAADWRTGSAGWVAWLMMVSQVYRFPAIRYAQAPAREAAFEPAVHPAERFLRVASGVHPSRVPANSGLRAPGFQPARGSAAACWSEA